MVSAKEVICYVGTLEPPQDAETFFLIRPLPKGRYLVLLRVRSLRALFCLRDEMLPHSGITQESQLDLQVTQLNFCSLILSLSPLSSP